MTKVGPFFFFSKREDEPFVNAHLWCIADVSNPAGLRFLQEKISKPIELWFALASGNLQWKVLFMVVMVMVMIIDSCYYKHHYYLVLLHSCMEH